MGIGLQRRCGQLFWQGDFLLPNGGKTGNVFAEGQGKALRQGAAVIALAVTVGQAGMVAGNAEGHQLACLVAEPFYRNFGARGGVVD